MCVEPAGEFGVLELGELLWDELPPAKSQKKNQLNRLPAEEAKEKSRKPAPGRSRFCTLFHCFNFFGRGEMRERRCPRHAQRSQRWPWLRDKRRLSFPRPTTNPPERVKSGGGRKAAVGERGERLCVGEPGRLSPDDSEWLSDVKLRLVWSRGDGCMAKRRKSDRRLAEREREREEQSSWPGWIF